MIGGGNDGTSRPTSDSSRRRLRPMKMTLTDLYLPMRHPFTIKHGTTKVQRNLLVTLTLKGECGYGEAASSRAYPKRTPAKARTDLESTRPLIESTEFTDPESLWKRVFHQLDHNRLALCALDEAAHDLWGKLHGKPVWKMWGLELRDLPVSNYTIGLDSIEAMVEKMKEFDGWPIYKIKLGTDRDLEIVRSLRRHTDATFRIDANTAWSAEQTLDFAPKFKELGVEFLEQPLARDDWEGMRRVYKDCVLPVIADESCQIEEDLEQCIGHFHGINIKLTKAGGLTPARRMISKARELGLKTMVGCMNESSVGISAIGQLLPLLDYVDIDGSVLITDDPATGVWLDKGVACFPKVNGNGVRYLQHRPVPEPL